MSLVQFFKANVLQLESQKNSEKLGQSQDFEILKLTKKLIYYDCKRIFANVFETSDYVYLNIFRTFPKKIAAIRCSEAEIMKIAEIGRFS